MATKKTGNTVGRPRAIDVAMEECIVDRMLDGENLGSICDSSDMPNPSTVYRHMSRNPEFARKIRMAREGFAEHLLHKILMAAEEMTADNVAEMTAKARIWQWAAVRCAPRIYSERVVAAQMAVPAVGTQSVQINNIDMKSMTNEELLELRRLLAKIKTNVTTNRDLSGNTAAAELTRQLVTTIKSH